MKSDTDPKPDTLALTYAAWLTRLWLAVRAIQTGIEKYAGKAVSSEVVDIDGEPNAYDLTSDSAEKVYSMANYHGVPAALEAKFASEPLIPGWFLGIYDKILGPALILLGLTILLGIASRTSLFLLGVLYISLTWGLILLGEPGNSGVAWLAAHIIVIAMSLQLSRYNKFCLLKKF